MPFLWIPWVDGRPKRIECGLKRNCFGVHGQVFKIHLTPPDYLKLIKIYILLQGFYTTITTKLTNSNFPRWHKLLVVLLIFLMITDFKSSIIYIVVCNIQIIYCISTTCNQRFPVDARGVIHSASYNKHDWLKPQTTKNWLDISQRLLID